MSLAMEGSEAILDAGIAMRNTVSLLERGGSLRPRSDTRSGAAARGMLAIGPQDETGSVLLAGHDLNS